MNKHRTIFILTAILILLMAIPASAEEHTFQYQKIVEVTEAVDLELTLATGKVEIFSVADDRVIIEAIKRVRAVDYDEAEEVADHIEIRTDVIGSTIKVSTNYLKLGARKKSFWGKLFGSASDSYGDVDYRISLPWTHSIKIMAMQSDITLSNIEGAIDINNAAGSIRGEFLSGTVTVSQPSGTIDLQWVEGDIRVSSNSGHVNIVQLAGSLDLTTSTGRIDVRSELDSPRDFFVETTTGEITLTVPESSSGLLVIETESGNIASEMPLAIKSTARHRLVGEFGAGGPKVTLSSSSGDVTVSQF